jgi:hypothetical protein
MPVFAGEPPGVNGNVPGTTVAPNSPLPNYNVEQIQSQITSIQQLRDVNPNNWSYEALRNLVDNYGCLVGYPDRTYRGDRPLSRYEFAAGLNACLQQLERRLLEARNSTAPSSSPIVLPVPTEPRENLGEVLKRATLHNTGDYYSLTDTWGILNSAFGWRTGWIPFTQGSYNDIMITRDGQLVGKILEDFYQQQSANSKLAGPDLPNPFNNSPSLEQNPCYTSRLGYSSNDPCAAAPPSNNTGFTPAIVLPSPVPVFPPFP